MGMRLTIDQGNTLAKLSCFEDDKLIIVRRHHELTTDVIDSYIAEYNIDKAIYSTVKDVDYNIIDHLKCNCSQVILFDEYTPLPITVAYRTPHTLGRDRVAAVMGAWTQKPQHNSLVIDAGTAITYDFIDANGIYAGGNIAPGLRLRFEALHQYTSKLPLVDQEGDTPLIGYDTTTAIRSGVVRGLVYEIESYIGELQQKYGDITVFLTGGHSIFLAKRLKSCIFANENLVSLGLNRILHYNETI